MNTVMKLPWMLVMLVLLSACSQAPVRDPASPFYRVPLGSEVILHQPLEIRPGHTRVFLQRGEASGFSGVDQYWPSCSFVVRDLKQEPQQIKPDHFTVTRVEQGNTQIVGWPQLQVAGLRLSQVFDRSGGEPLVARYYDIWLSSDQQPNVLRMRCFGAMADLTEAHLPQFIEIEAALGTLATVRI